MQINTYSPNIQRVFTYNIYVHIHYYVYSNVYVHIYSCIIRHVPYNAVTCKYRVYIIICMDLIQYILPMYLYKVHRVPHYIIICTQYMYMRLLIIIIMSILSLTRGTLLCRYIHLIQGYNITIVHGDIYIPLATFLLCHGPGCIHYVQLNTNRYQVSVRYTYNAYIRSYQVYKLHECSYIQYIVTVIYRQCNIRQWHTLVALYNV